MLQAKKFASREKIRLVENGLYSPGLPPLSPSTIKYHEEDATVPLPQAFCLGLLAGCAGQTRVKSDLKFREETPAE